MNEEQKFVSVRGVRLHYVDWGPNGPPLLLLHGNQRSSRSWDAVARRLQDRFHVMALDARGHGDSERTPRGYRTVDRVADLMAFLEAVGLRRVSVVAHSVGGGVAAFAALQEPALFQSLFLVEPLLVLDERFQTNRLRQGAESRRSWPNRKEFHDYLLWHWVTQVWDREVIEDVAQHEVRELADGSVESKWATETYNGEDRQDDLYNLLLQLPGLQIPTCILLSGSRSKTEIGALETLVPKMRDGQLVLFEGVGHNVYMEQPQVIANLILDYQAGRSLPRKIAAPASARNPKPKSWLNDECPGYI